jgi:hypothetical protein
VTDRKEVDDLFRCLLSDISANADSPQRRSEESRQLLCAFHSIDDSKLRQELIALIEIISRMPEALQSYKGRVAGQLTSMH